MHTLLASGALVLGWAGPGTAEVQRAAESVLARTDYQRRLPYGGAEPDGGAGLRLGRAAPGADEGTPRPLSVSVPPMLVWILAAAAGLALVLWARHEFGHATRLPSLAADESETDGRAPPTLPRRGPRAPVLDDAERLAAEGRFAEAIHALLLGSLARLAPARALTAREVLRQADVGDEARSALAALVGEAERVHFAGGAAGAGEFERCREHWRRFGAARRAARA